MLSCIVPDCAALHPGYFALLLPPRRGKAGMGVVLYGYMVPAVVFGWSPRIPLSLYPGYA